MEELRHRRVPAVVLQALVVLDEAVVDQVLLLTAADEASGRVPLGNLLSDVLEGDAADTRGRADERRVDELLPDADRLKDLCAVVRREERDANLREDLQHTGLESLARVDVRLVERDVGQHAGRTHLGALVRLIEPLRRLEHEMRVDGRRAEANQARDMMGRPRLAGLGDDGSVKTDTRVDEVMVDRADGNERRDERIIDVNAALLLVGQNDDFGTIPHLLLSLRDEVLDRSLQTARAGRDRIDGRDSRRLACLADLIELRLVHHRRRNAKLHRAVLGRRVAEVVALTKRHIKRHHDTLTKRVDRWVGHLREALLEVVVDGMRLLGEHGKWRVLTEREEGLLPSVRHVAELHLDVL